MKPSSVATRSSTRGTSCGWTVVTRTSGGGGAVCAGLREQPTNNEPQISMALTRTIRLILLLSLLVFGCRAGTWRCAICLSGDCRSDLLRAEVATVKEQTELPLRTAGHCFHA